MKRCVFAGLVVLGASVLSLAAVSGQQAPAPTSRTLGLPEVPYRYSLLNLPSHFNQPAALRFDNTPADNPVTDHGATLGRVLFYDTRLSANNTISCGSCHVQSHAFVDPNRFSKGFKGGLTDRHAMNLVNLRYHPRAGSSGTSGAATSKRWCCCRSQNSLEMGQDLLKLPGILAREPRYAELFRQAFGDPEITHDRIALALAQFLRAMVSYQSKYDEGRAGPLSVKRRLRQLHPRGESGQGLVPSQLRPLSPSGSGRAFRHDRAGEHRAGCGDAAHRWRRR